MGVRYVKKKVRSAEELKRDKANTKRRARYKKTKAQRNAARRAQYKTLDLDKVNAVRRAAHAKKTCTLPQE